MDEMEALAMKLGLLQESNEEVIGVMVDKALSDNPNTVHDIKDGKTKAISFLVGQVMKESGGRANPQIAQKLIQQKIQ